MASDGARARTGRRLARLNVPSHPNLLWNLNRAPLGETFAPLIEGTFTPDCAPGFGASITLYMDHAEPGKAVRYPETVGRNIYPIDVYREKDELLTAGYYGEALLLACAFGYTIPTAWDAALEVASSGAVLSHRWRRHGLPLISLAAVRGTRGDGVPEGPLEKSASTDIFRGGRATAR